MDAIIRVLLADDHPMMRVGIRETLASAPDIVLAGEVGNGYEAQQACGLLAPHVLLLDLNMPGPLPAETVAFVNKHHPATKVVIMTAYDDDIYIRGLLSVGVSGYVLKDEAADQVVQAIRVVAKGGTWFSRSIADRFGQWAGGANRSGAFTLTERELDVLRLVVEGQTNLEIAAELRISEKTVAKHLGEVFARLGVSSRVEAAVLAVRVGLV
jgi:DNA-binding NarL/FixJ family response regulator